MHLPDTVKIVDVGPRDGLQNEAQTIPPAIKIELIDLLSKASIPVIEVGSFVSPKWIPQMADTQTVYEGIDRLSDIRYPVLVPNMKGFEDAQQTGVKDIAIFAAASETFSQKNINCSIAESLKRFAPVCTAAQESGINVRGYVSCVLGCPYEGDVAPTAVADLSLKLLELGCEEISLGDTTGVGTPAKAQTLVDTVADKVPVAKLAAHFHDTYGQALANLLAVMEKGIATIDSSVAGLGGCPYAKGATGNVASEDVLYMLNGLSIKTGVDLDKLIEAGRFISGHLNRQPYSKVSHALS
jgi:isopropylmalate/homocitrate/citramalate synthase